MVVTKNILVHPESNKAVYLNAEYGFYLMSIEDFELNELFFITEEEYANSLDHSDMDFYDDDLGGEVPFSDFMMKELKIEFDI